MSSLSPDDYLRYCTSARKRGRKPDDRETWQQKQRERQARLQLYVDRAPDPEEVRRLIGEQLSERITAAIHRAYFDGDSEPLAKLFDSELVAVPRELLPPELSARFDQHAANIATLLRHRIIDPRRGKGTARKRGVKPDALQRHPIDQAKREVLRICRKILKTEQAKRRRRSGNNVLHVLPGTYREIVEHVLSTSPWSHPDLNADVIISELRKNERKHKRN